MIDSTSYRQIDLSDDAPSASRDDFADLNASVSRFQLLQLDDDPAPGPVNRLEVKTIRGDGPVRSFRGGFAREGDQIHHVLDGTLSASQAIQKFFPWTVSKQPVTDGNGEPSDRFYKLIRDDTGQLLGTVGRRYQPLQNTVLSCLDGFTQRAPIVRAGEFDQGRRVWLQTGLRTFKTPSGPAELHGLAHTGHAGEASLSFSLTGTVVVCRNTCDMALAEAPHQVTIKHTSGAKARLDMIERGLSMAERYGRELEECFGAMGRRKVTSEELDEFVGVLFPTNKDGERSAKSENMVERFLLGYEEAPGAQPGTAWGLYQAATFYEGHTRFLQSATDPLESTWFGSGKQLREKAARQVVRLVRG